MRLDKESIKRALTLYAVTDRAWLGQDAMCQAVEKALLGGATMIQLREKDMPHDDFLKEALEVKEVCRKYGVPFIINDNVQIALECGADGIHVGQEDMDAAGAREILGPYAIIGVSAHSLEEAQRAKAMGADYLGVGAVFPTTTKLDAESTALGRLEEICRMGGLPVVAIGGINAGNISRLSGMGVCGVSVVSAIFAQKDITAAAQHLRVLAQEVRGEN